MKLFRKNRNFSAIDYGIALIADPKLARLAWRSISKRRSRRVKAALIASRDRVSPVKDAPVFKDNMEVAQDLGARMGVVVLDDSPTDFCIGVADINIIVAILYFRQNLPEFKVSLDGKPFHYDSENFKKTATTARQVQIGFHINGANTTIGIERFDHIEDQKWVSPNTANVALRALYSDCLTRPGVTLATDILGGRPLTQVRENLPIDVVFTWVNHEDPDWQVRYANHAPQSEAGTDAKSKSRFHNNDELKYSLRSVAQNLPWVRNIYVFTNCAAPEWLDIESSRIHWVMHDEVMPEASLPTFSSHAIESYLHKIPGLSEHFLYLNDDVFIARPLMKEYYITANLATKSFMEPYGMVSGDVLSDDPDYLNASRNSADLLRQKFGFAATQLHKHVGFCLRKSTLEAIEADFPDAFATTRANRFRESTDINLVSFLYHHYGYGKGLCAFEKANNALVKNGDIRWRSKLEAANGKAIEIICINEGGDTKAAKKWHKQVSAFLEAKYPNPAEWEV